MKPRERKQNPLLVKVNLWDFLQHVLATRHNIHLLFVKMEFDTYGEIRFFNSKSVSKYKEKKKSYVQNFLIYPVKTL